MHGCSGNRARRIAYRDLLRRQQMRLCRQRILNGKNRRQRLNLRLQHGKGRQRRITRCAHHQRNGLAVMAQDAIGKKRFNFPARRRDIICPQHIPRGDDCNNTRHGARRRDIQSPKPPMRNGRKQQGAMQQPRHFRHIIREGRTARHMTKRGIMRQR